MNNQKTPLYEVTYLYNGNIKKIYVKDESKNISGSIKYRPAKLMMEKAYEEHIIDKDSKICEVTSGNMGIALATICKNTGNEVTIIMPKHASLERRKILQDLGANLILTSGFVESFDTCKKLEDMGYICLHQFENIYNALSYHSLCEELEDSINEFTGIVAGVGTGGTLNGIGRYLKDKYNSKVIAVEPYETLLLSTGKSNGIHKIEGLSDEKVPKLYPSDIVDKIISIKSDDAICMARKLKEELGLNVGISSGANFLASILCGIDKVITVFPDDDTKYTSTDLYNYNITSPLVDSINLISKNKK